MNSVRANRARRCGSVAEIVVGPGAWVSDVYVHSVLYGVVWRWCSESDGVLVGAECAPALFSAMLVEFAVQALGALGVGIGGLVHG